MGVYGQVVGMDGYHRPLKGPPALKYPGTCWLLERKGEEADGRPVTLGALYQDEGQVLAVTAELPWMDNRPNVSCVRADLYQVVAHPTEPDAKVRLMNPPDADALRGRTNINGEIGNWPTGAPGKEHGDPRGKPQSRGCWFPGTRFAYDRSGVMGSRDAMAHVLAAARECWALGDLYLWIRWGGPDG